MAEIVITRGLPASGKTTWARDWVAGLPNLRARVNRDDLRQNLFGADYPLHPDHNVAYGMEKAVTAAQREAVRGLLSAGRSVVVDDTHLRQRYIRQWRELAEELGAGFRVEDSFLDVSTDECVRRDQIRSRSGGRFVGADVIREMAERLKNSLTSDVETDGGYTYTYVPDMSKPRAWIVDIDGTLAHTNGRSPYDYIRVSEDTPDENVISLVNGLYAEANRIIVVSGREDSCRGDTQAWLYEYVGWAWTHGWKLSKDEAPLYMRATGDKRDDATVKAELFFEHIAPNYNVRGVLDDRNRVVRMWRSLGLLCCQVAPGAF